MALSKIVRDSLNTGIDDNSDATAITIDSSEKVGIGDTSPLGNKVHIRTAGSATSVNGDAGLVLESDDSTRCDLQFMGPDGAFQSVYFGDVSDDNRGIIAYSHSGNNMRFTVDASERMRLTSDGLTFNGDTAAANALSDYEEGTFEPTFTSSGGDFTSAGYNADTGGRYIKIGNLVLVTGCARLNGTLDKSNVSGSANLRIGNLPFNNSARSNGDNADGPHTIRVPVWSSGDVPDRSNMNPGANAMTLYKQNTDNNVAEVITVTDLPNDAMVQFSATYTTN